MRLFTAVDLPAAIVERLDRFQQSLKPLAKINWSPVSNLHITTKFLGEVAEDQLDALKPALAALPKREPISIGVRGAGFFPRVFWVGVDAPALEALHADTDAAVSAFGVAREQRPYHPHLTLARIREPRPLAALHVALATADTEFGDFTADRQFLYLSRAGQYTKLSEHPFA